MTGQPEVAFRYDRGPTFTLWREPLDDDRSMHWITVQDGRPGVALVVTDGTRVLLQRQWRRAIERSVWQFPRGFGDPGESTTVTDDARRELEEETGITATSLVECGLFYPDSGMLATAIAVVEARVDDLDSIRAASTDDDERIEAFSAVALDELDEWIRDGRLVDGISIAALQVWRSHSR